MFDEFKRKQEVDDTCPQHGVKLWYVPIAGKDLAPFCPICTQERIDKEVQEITEQSINQEHYWRTSDVLERDSDIPKKLQNANFENFIANTTEERQLLSFMRGQATKYLNDMKGNTILTGNTGSGKSHLSLALARAINDGYKAKNEPKSVLFVSYADMIARIKDSWKNGKANDNTELETVRRLSGVDFLVIDDLGAKNAEVRSRSDWEQDLLFKILNDRERTIFNTNLTSDELRTQFNNRNYSRILEGADGNIFLIRSITDKRFKKG